MRSVLFHAIVATAMAVSVNGLAKGVKPAQITLDGTWQDNDFRLIVDAVRMQANTDPKKPFQWDAVKILNISGSMIVFDIGTQRYIARVETDASMKLTGGNLLGEHLLVRQGGRTR